MMSLPPTISEEQGLKSHIQTDYSIHPIYWSSTEAGTWPCQNNSDSLRKICTDTGEQAGRAFCN